MQVELEEANKMWIVKFRAKMAESMPSASIASIANFLIRKASRDIELQEKQNHEPKRKS